MRIASFVAASVAGLLSVGLIAAGALLLWGNAQKDDDGYLTTSTERFATGTRAMATDNLDVNSGGTGWIVDHDRYGRIRLIVDADAPVFAGIAPTRDVDGYLGGTSHDVVTDLDYDPFSADYERHDGHRRPGAPAAQDFWAASTHGAGRRTLTWDARHGDWSVVVMNEDGSPGVEARISAGAEVPFLGPLGWGLGIGGAVLLVFAAGLAVVGARAPRRAPVAA
jgi:hypothetical protein